MTRGREYYAPSSYSKASDEQIKTDKIISYISIGYEILELVANVNNHDQVYEIAVSCQKLTKNDDLDDLSGWFFNFADFMDVIDMQSDGYVEYYQKRLLQELKQIHNKYKIAPKTTSIESVLLNKNTLPIHEKMMNNPEESPKYFIEMAFCLDGLIKDSLLNISTARWELTNAISRPQIAQCEKLQKSLKILDTIPLPEKTYEIDINKIWDDFIQEIQSMNF